METNTNYAYSSEIRFGVVMYGGVSLAIYINGVANELYEMSCGTPKDIPGTVSMEGTREIYRRLAWLADNPAMRKEYAELINQAQTSLPNKTLGDAWKDALIADNIHPEAVRFVVDVISGTSAGGINGIFLAKALANGESFKPLEKLWINEGDISLLLNDSGSYKGLENIHKRTACPQSLLNGDRMYLKLYDAMQAMSKTKPEFGSSPLVEEVDLFVTTTDICGSPVPIRLSGQTVYERRHKQNFHFYYSADQAQNHFEKENNGLLAFAARCTSSFPFAFEPMTMAAVKQLKPELGDAIDKEWPNFLAYLPQQEVADKRHVLRAFGDGGYLDNKPFTYVAKTLAIRQATVPVERKLIYIEPSPERLDPMDSLDPTTAVPDAVTNSLAALTGIPRYETIREDLQDVLKRNRSIERVERIVREGEYDLRLALSDRDSSAEKSNATIGVNPFVRIIKEGKGSVPPWPEFTRSKMVRYYGTAILAYHRLRVSTVTDSVGQRLAEMWGIDTGSDYLYALTALVRAWRDDHYCEDGAAEVGLTLNMFLNEFDIDYRIRKLGFLLRQIDQLQRLIRMRGCGIFRTSEYDHLPATDKLNIDRLRSAGWNIRDADPPPESLKNALEALHQLKGALNEALRDWRLIRQNRGQQIAEKKLNDERMRQELKNILAMLLGECSEDSLQLHLRSGGVTGVKLSEETQKLAFRARSLQERVVVRAKGLFHAALEAEKTLIQELLEDALESLKKTNSKPNTYTILGCPSLCLVPPFDENGQSQSYQYLDNEKVEVHVKDVDNPALNTSEGTILRRLIGEYYLYFDLFDQMSFPLYYDAGIGEPAIVEVSRISPKDATSLVNESTDARRKLAGTALANFGAFIERNWRINDIMWGRLDGAERLIHMLLPMRDKATETVRNELIRQAQARILRETFVPKTAGELTDLLCAALAEIGNNGNRMQQVRTLLDRVMPGKLDQNRQTELANLLASLVHEEQLIRYMQTTRDIERKTNARESLSNASRAIAIVGRILEGISKRQDRGSFLFRWMARGGLIFQCLIAVSVPNTIPALMRAHMIAVWYWIAGILMLFSLITGAFALFTGTGDILSFAVKMFFITLFIQIIVFVLGDIMRTDDGWFRRGLRSGALAVVLLALFGSFSAYTKLHDLTNGSAASKLTHVPSWVASVLRR